MPRCSDGLSMGGGTSNRRGWGREGEIAVEARKRRGVREMWGRESREDANALTDLIDHVVPRSDVFAGRFVNAKTPSSI